MEYQPALIFPFFCHGSNLESILNKDDSFFSYTLMDIMLNQLRKKKVYTLAHIHKNIKKKKNVLFRSKNCYHDSFISIHYFLADIHQLETHFATTIVITVENNEVTDENAENNGNEVNQPVPTFIKKYKHRYFHGQDIDFFAFFLLREVQSKADKEITVIPTEISQTIKDLVDILIEEGKSSMINKVHNAINALQKCIKNLHIYLFSNPTIVTNKLIFLSITDQVHWTGVCAVNPCVNHEENNNVCITGCISFDSMSMYKETDETSKSQLYLTFFLNLAIYY